VLEEDSGKYSVIENRNLARSIYTAKNTYAMNEFMQTDDFYDREESDSSLSYYRESEQRKGDNKFLGVGGSINTNVRTDFYETNNGNLFYKINLLHLHAMVPPSSF
jgi:hypothetical protein